MGNGFFKEVVPVITSFVKLTKKRNANQFIINQLASQVVDYYDKLSNLLDAIRSLNLTAREIQGRGRSVKKQLLAFCKKDDHLFSGKPSIAYR